MANLSTAFGNSQITAPSYEEAETLLKLFHAYQSDYGDYSTWYSESRDRDPDTEGRIICTFDATGRWSFSTNIECFGKWLNHDVSNEHRKFIESIPWTVKYWYTDYEPGCEVLGQGWDKVVHQAGQSLEDVEYISGDWNDYPMTYYNIMDLMQWDVDDVLGDRYAYSVLDGENDISEYADDLIQFIEDYAMASGISTQRSKQILCEESEDLTQLLAMAERYLGREVA